MLAVPEIEAESGWRASDIPAEAAIRGLHGVSLLVGEAAPTGSILTGVLGFREIGREGSTIRFRSEGGALGGVVDVREAGGFLAGRPGAGTVHHVAFRAANDEAQAEMVAKLEKDHGIIATDQRIAITFARSISANRAGCCSKSPRTSPVSRSMNPLQLSGRP